MLLNAFLQSFESLPPEKYRTLGGSSAGSCARRLAYSHFPERFTPAPMTARRRARLMAGREFERICLGVVQKSLPAHAAGETAFLWPVPVDLDTLLVVRDKITEGRIVGHLLPHMNPNDIARWRASCARAGMTRLGGIVVDTVRSIIYLPVLVDFIADMSEHYPGYGMAVGDFKTIATAGFRHVMGGALDYGYRTQFALEADAANVDTFIGLFYRLETSHGIEIIYSRKADTMRATFNLSNGKTYVSEGGIEQPKDEWDDVQVETPFDPALLEQARARVRLVLGSTIDTLPEREYGPDFACHDCDGVGTLKCGYCTDEGISKRSLKGKDGQPKEGKPCKRAGCDHGRRACKCDGSGQLQETELPFPCNGWCPFMESCYPFVNRVMPTKAFGRPKFMVSRADYEASGITFTNPEVRA